MQDNSELDVLVWLAFASQARRYLYVSTPKAACTTLKWWFAAQEGYSKAINAHEPSEESSGELIIHDVLPRLFPDCKIGSLPELLEFARRPDVLSFAVVRNPYTRVFSAWQSKLLLREPLQIAPYRDFHFSNLSIRNKADLVESFEMFLEHLHAREAPHFWDSHWAGQWQLLRPDVLPYSIVAKLEDPGELRSRLASHIGFGYSDPFSGEVRNDSIVSYSDAYFTARAARLVREMYAEDFERFEYSTQLPAGAPALNEDQFSLAAKAIAMIRARHDRIAIQRSWDQRRFADLAEAAERKDAEIAKNTDTLSALAEAISAMGSALQANTERLAKHEADLVHRYEQLQALNDGLSLCQAKQATLEEALSAMGSALQANTERLAKHEADLLQRDDQLGTLQNSLSALQASIERDAVALKLKRFAFSTAMTTVRVISRLPGGQGDQAYRFYRGVYRLLPLPRQLKRRLGERALLSNPSLMNMAYYRNTVDLAQGVEVQTSFQHGDMNGFTPAAALRRNPTWNRVLVVEHRIPTPDRTSGSVRLDAILQAMSDEGLQITFISHALPQDYHWVLNDVDAELPRYEKALHDRGISICYGAQAAMQLLSEEGYSFRCAFLSYPEIAHQYAPLARAFMANSLLVYDTVDLHGLRYRREAELKNMDPGLLSKADYYDRIENANLEVADIVVAITEDEESEILSRAPQARIEIIPNIHHLHPPTNPPEERQGLVFIGHYLHAPNADAVQYFVRDILPLIQAQLEDVDFFMLGSSITDEVRRLASQRVHAIGFVEEPEEWFERARVFVAPLRFGAGMKGKLGQSLACGLPIVTTSIGAEGMHLNHEEHALIADDPRRFAEQVVRLYRDDHLWKRLSAAGMDHVQTHFSPLVARAAIGRLHAAMTSRVEV